MKLLIEIKKKNISIEIDENQSIADLKEKLKFKKKFTITVIRIFPFYVILKHGNVILDDDKSINDCALKNGDKLTIMLNVPWNESSTGYYTTMEYHAKISDLAKFCCEQLAVPEVDVNLGSKCKNNDEIRKYFVKENVAFEIIIKNDSPKSEPVKGENKIVKNSPKKRYSKTDSITRLSVNENTYPKNGNIDSITKNEELDHDIEKESIENLVKTNEITSQIENIEENSPEDEKDDKPKLIKEEFGLEALSLNVANDDDKENNLIVNINSFPLAEHIEDTYHEVKNNNECNGDNNLDQKIDTFSIQSGFGETTNEIEVSNLENNIYSCDETKLSNIDFDESNADLQCIEPNTNNSTDESINEITLVVDNCAQELSTIDNKELHKDDITQEVNISHGSIGEMINETSDADCCLKINIRVRNTFTTDENCPVSQVSIYYDDTIDSLRQKIDAVFDFKSENYVISYDDEILNKDNKISTYGIKDGDELVIGNSLTVRYFSSADTVSAKLQRIPFSGNDAVLDLKERINKKMQIPIRSILLAFEGTSLNDDLKLAHYDIPNDSFLIMVSTVTGGI